MPTDPPGNGDEPVDLPNAGGVTADPSSDGPQTSISGGTGDHSAAPADVDDGAGSAVSALVAMDRLPKVFWRGLLAIGFAVALFLVVRGLVERLESLIRLIIISLFVSFALEPVVNWLHKRGWKRGVATMTCFLVVFGMGGLFVGVMTSMVVTQTSELAEKAPDYVTKTTRWINDTFDTDITSKELNKTIRQYQDDLAGMATDVGGRVITVTGAVLGTIFQTLTVFLFSFYIIAEGPQLRRHVCSLLPARRQKLVLDLWELSIAKTGGWVYSRVILALVSAATSWIVFALIGLPSPGALALWMGLVSQFIPVVGTYIGGALPVLIALVNDPVQVLWVVGWILVYQQIENYLLSPRITSHAMNLHPAVAFGAALGGGSLFGAAGAILALPAAAVIQAFVSSYLGRHEVVESDLTSLDTGA